MWKLISFVKKSKQRQMIFLSLENPKTPSEVASKTKLSLPQVSRTLSQFSKIGIIECMTPNEKRGRIYKLTKKGREVLKSIK